MSMYFLIFCLVVGLFAYGLAVVCEEITGARGYRAHRAEQDRLAAQLVR